MGFTKEEVMFNSSLDAYSGAKPVASLDKVLVKSNVDVIVSASTFVSPPVALAVTVKIETKQSTALEKAALEIAVKKLNELVAPSLQSVQFAMDEEENRVVVKVVDTATHKVLRQIPNEEVLAFSKTLGRLQGLVVSEKA